MSMRSNRKGLSRGPAAGLTALLSFFATTAFAPELPCSFVYAQTGGRVRNLQVDFVPEGGCPVEPTSIRCELDVDPFDAPMDARVYVDYRNNSDRAVAAVKFRLRFVDAQNRDKGTFHAVDMSLVSPQGSHGLKAKRDFTLHPAVTSLKARVLQVKYQDGSDWTSTKMQELAQPASAVSGGGGYSGGSSAGAGLGDSDGGGDLPPQSAAPVQSYPAYASPAAPAQAPRQAQAPAQNPVSPQQKSSPPPWSANPREYENPSAAVPPANRGLSAGADVSDPFAGGAGSAGGGAAPSASASPVSQQAPPQAPLGQAVADPAANNPAAAAPAASAAAAVPTNSAAAVPVTPPASTTGRYQGVQPTNVPFSPDNDK